MPILGKFFKTTCFSRLLAIINTLLSQYVHMIPMRRKTSQLADPDARENLKNGVWESPLLWLVVAHLPDALMHTTEPGINPDISRLRASYEANLAPTIAYMHRQWTLLSCISLKFAHMKDL